jgi:hypothetical protein
MKIRHRNQFGFPLGNPVLPVFPLAFGTMPISTTVITDRHYLAFGASVYTCAPWRMSSEVCRAAAFQRRQGSELPTVDLRMLFYFLPVLSKHMCHFEQ